MGHWLHYNKHHDQIEITLINRPPLIITKKDLDISFFSTGPGGQNVNKTMNGVRLIYRLPLDYRQNFKKTAEFVIRSIRQRSREQNFKNALAILAKKLERYFYVPPQREKTKIPRSSKESRLKGKKMRAQLKASRANVDF